MCLIVLVIFLHPFQGCPRLSWQLGEFQKQVFGSYRAGSEAQCNQTGPGHREKGCQDPGAADITLVYQKNQSVDQGAAAQEGRQSKALLYLLYRWLLLRGRWTRWIKTTFPVCRLVGDLLWLPHCISTLLTNGAPGSSGRFHLASPSLRAKVAKLANIQVQWASPNLVLILKCVIFLLQFSLFYVLELFDADISHENIVSNIFHSLLLKLEYVVSAVIKSLCFRCVRDQQDF